MAEFIPPFSVARQATGRVGTAAGFSFHATKDLGADADYPIPLHPQPPQRAFTPTAPLPESERAGRKVLALPLHPELTSGEIERVVSALRACCR